MIEISSGGISESHWFEAKALHLRPLSIKEPTRSLPTTTTTTTAPTALGLLLSLLRMALQTRETFPTTTTATSAERFRDPSERVVGDEGGSGIGTARAGEAAGGA